MELFVSRSEGYESNGVFNTEDELQSYISHEEINDYVIVPEGSTLDEVLKADSF